MGVKYYKFKVIEGKVVAIPLPYESEIENFGITLLKEDDGKIFSMVVEIPETTFEEIDKDSGEIITRKITIETHQIPLKYDPLIISAEDKLPPINGVELYEIKNGGYLRFSEEKINNLKLERLKKEKIRQLFVFDGSSEVNIFYLNGSPLWVKKETRSTIFSSLTAEKRLKMTQTKLNINGNILILNTNKAIFLLAKIEVYSKKCYLQTSKHKRNINSLSTSEEVTKYDFKLGYPEKIKLTL